MAVNNTPSTNYMQDTNQWNNAEEPSAVDARLSESNANAEAVLDANKAVTEANTEANTQKEIEGAQTTQQVGGGMQAVGGLMSTVGAGCPPVAIIGAVINIAGAVTTQVGAAKESSATNDASKAIASSENLATTTDKGVKDIKSATAEATVEGTVEEPVVA